jgi:hypothetical protein
MSYSVKVEHVSVLMVGVSTPAIRAIWLKIQQDGLSEEAQPGVECEGEEMNFGGKL